MTPNRPVCERTRLHVGARCRFPRRSRSALPTPRSTYAGSTRTIVPPTGPLGRAPWAEKRCHLSPFPSRSAAAAFSGKGIYSRSRAIDRVQWPVLIRRYVEEHGSISNRECRELLLLGNSRFAVSTISQLLIQLDFLEPYGPSKQLTRYRLKGK